MSTADSATTSERRFEQALRQLTALRNASGTAEQFWDRYVNGLHQLVNAHFSVIALSVEVDDGAREWRIRAMCPQRTENVQPPAEFVREISPSADSCLAGGSTIKQVSIPVRGLKDCWILGVRLDTGQPNLQMVALALVSRTREARADELVCQLGLAADVPRSYLFANASSEAGERAQQFSSTLDLLVQLNREERFLSAAMLVCNELSARHQCGRVSIGWRKGKYVRLKAMSHVDRFEKKMDAVGQLERAMEECLDQDQEVVVPRPEAATFISRDHEAFCRQQGAGAVCSVPLRDGRNRCQAVLTFERSSGTFSENELRHLRLTADQAMPRLQELKDRDRWFGARMASWLRRMLGLVFGVEHTWMKLLVLVIVAVLVFLATFRMEYRVEAPFVIQSRDVAYIPVPYDGYIAEVKAEIGQRIETGDALVEMDTQDLLLERAAAVAERNRRMREREKARGENALADVQISDALLEQARIRIQAVDEKLSKSTIKAPLGGVIVRGDMAGELHQRLNAPVRRGDVLIKIASLENIYIECRVDERDVEHVAEEATGEIAFASQPELKFPMVLKAIDPAAVPSADGNHFVAQCEFSEPPQGWFRPGMAGLAKINAGERSLIWIFTHRTIDFLYMFFWV